MLVLLVTVYGAHVVFGLFLPDKNIPPCYGLYCKNNGTVDPNTCSCLCMDGFQGILCDSELKASAWPGGSYSLLSTTFGCPEPENFGWKRGHVNLTVSAETNSRQWFPERFRLLGPYHLHTIQLNFCTRNGNHPRPLASNTSLSAGSYCLFRSEEESCPGDFNESSLPLKDYSIREDDIGGVVPDVNISDDGIKLTLCCRDDRENGTAIDMPTAFPFYLLKPFPLKPCQEVTGMVTTEEKFSFVKTNNRTWMGRDGIFTVEESDLYFNLTFCYYEPYERRECMYSDDKGVSYRGRMNVTKSGKPCRVWKEVKPDTNDLDYEGDYEQNYCRQSIFSWTSYAAPYCYVTNITSRMYCDIPKCDTSKDPPNVIKGKIYRSTPAEAQTPIENIADDYYGKPPFAIPGSYIEPWVQVDFQEDYEIYSVVAIKIYNYVPFANRHIVTYVSRHQWDFLTFGAQTCEGPYNAASSVRFQCRRPLTGSFVTLQNFVNYDPFFNSYRQTRLEIAELIIHGKATGCGKSVGIKTGDVDDFQISSSSNGDGYYPHHARLNRDTGWCAQSGDLRPYLQVDLLTPMVVQGIIIQGWTDGRTDHIPNNFTIEYGQWGENLTAFRNSFGETKVFRVDQTYIPSKPQKILLPHQLLVQVIRIYFYQQTSPVCVKFDLIGCPRKVDFDLRCQTGSRRFGFQVLPGHTYNQRHLNTAAQNMSLQDCRSYYLMNLNFFSAYFYLHSSSSCSIIIIDRYNRHGQMWWETGHDSDVEYGQLMCVKETTGAQTCGGLVRNVGEVVSPYYPFYFGENRNCTWTVSLEDGEFVSLYFIDIDLPEKEEAIDSTEYFECEDKVTIVDRNRPEEPVVTTATGYHFATLEGPRYISSSNEIEINLVSCYRIQETIARGFAIKVDVEGCGGCGQGRSSCSRAAVCTSPCGYITSPDFPNFYPVSSSCQWLIRGQQSQYVTVTFDMIDVIADEQCEGDYVTLYDLDLSEERSIIGKFCKFNRPIQKVESSWHMMEVEFYSDLQTIGRGFRLKYALKTIILQSNILNSSVECNNTFHEYGQGCYSFKTQPNGITWLDAEKQCNKEGGHLVSISDTKEMIFLHSTIINENLFSTHAAYIGLRRTETGEYEWADGKPLTHTEWQQGQPDGIDNEACTMIQISGIKSTSHWNDVACAYDRITHYICEKEDQSVFPQETAQDQIIDENPVTVKEGYYFWCNSGEHISSLYQCDGSPDCNDGSDEHNCTKDNCPRGMFPCNDINGGCVDIAFYCDHKPDCLDGSDEDKCVFTKCTADEWKCESGQCIAKQRRCDLIQDCLFGSDEYNCEGCQEPFFQCYDGRCLTPSRVCDGFVDCGGQYNEDEGPQCTTNSQPSCTAWHALGAKQNGKYYIHMKENSGSFPVECVFDKKEDMITTIIHHSMEDWAVTGSLGFDDKIHYTVPAEVSSFVISVSSKCRQRVEIDCLQVYAPYAYYSWWYDGNGNKRKFISEHGSKCKCILTDHCDPKDGRCACQKQPKELFKLDPNKWLSDSGYIEDMDSLPITKLKFARLTRLQRWRHRIGPLICEEPTQRSASSLLCKSGAVVDVSHKCILDYNIYNHNTGCRDLTHLEGCDDFKCPVDHIKCPSSFCIPLRLVCNGHRDCVDGMDERGCFNMTCPGRFSCRGNTVCLPWDQVCDETEHCPDGDDEYFCNTSCPDACMCNGSYSTCTDLTLDQVGHLPSDTRELELRHSFNKSIPNDTFAHMKNLAMLDLSSLDIYELESNCFSGMRNVFLLDLSMNSIQLIPKGLFRNMGKLKKLLMTGNNIFKITAGSFDGLSMLPSLDMSNMFINKLEENVFRGLQSLLFLNLSSNKITTVHDKAFGGLGILDSLDLRRNPITKFSKGIFFGLDTLTHLYSDKYVFCCFRPSSVQKQQCLPQADEFSSCSDLMRKEALRISMWVLGIIALMGNIVALVYRCIYSRRGQNRSNDVFVANLALSDFLMGVYMIIIASADVYYRGIYSLNDEVWRGSWICQMAGFLSALSSETSVMFIVMITMERMMVIRFPFGGFSRFFQKKMKLICLSTWFLGILLAGIPLLPIPYFSGSFYSRSGVCLALPLTRNRPPGWEYSTAVFVFWNFVCFVIIAFGQAVIYHAVKASRALRMGRTNNDMAIARKLSFIVLTDFICWFPICVMGLMALQGHVIGSEVYAWVAVLVLPVNSALNPIIYTLSSVSTMRQRKMKRTWTNSSTYHTDVQDIQKRTPAVSKKIYITETKPSNSIRLCIYMKSFTSAADILTIVHKTVMSLNLLHVRGLVSGEVDVDNVSIICEKDVVTKIILACNPVPSETEEELKKDILDFGHFLSRLLKAYTVTKKERALYLEHQSKV